MDLLEAAAFMSLMAGNVLAVIISSRVHTADRRAVAKTTHGPAPEQDSAASAVGPSVAAGFGRDPQRWAAVFPLALGLLLCMTPSGQADERDGAVFGEHVTVLTLAHDGAWGTATDTSVSRAIAFAIRNCQAMSRRQLGCGAMYTTVRSGWSVALLCGDEPIIAAAAERAEAERRTLEREAELREVYRRAMSPCVRMVTVDPNGMVVTPPLYTSGR